MVSYVTGKCKINNSQFYALPSTGRVRRTTVVPLRAILRPVELGGTRKNERKIKITNERHKQAGERGCATVHREKIQSDDNAHQAMTTCVFCVRVRVLLHGLLVGHDRCRSVATIVAIRAEYLADGYSMHMHVDTHTSVVHTCGDGECGTFGPRFPLSLLGVALFFSLCRYLLLAKSQTKKLTTLVNATCTYHDLGLLPRRESCAQNALPRGSQRVLVGY